MQLSVLRRPLLEDYGQILLIPLTIRGRSWLDHLVGLERLTLLVINIRGPHFTHLTGLLQLELIYLIHSININRFMFNNLTLLRLSCSHDHHIQEPLLPCHLDHMHRGPWDSSLHWAWLWLKLLRSLETLVWLFLWVYVLERVRMGASLWDSILVYILGESMSNPFDFCERGKRPFLRISGSLPYSSLHPFYVTYLHALMQVDHHSLFYLFVFFYLYFIPPFHSISSDFFLFSSYLMFDLGLASTLYSCLFDMSIPLSSLFV